MKKYTALLIIAMIVNNYSPAIAQEAKVNTKIQGAIEENVGLTLIDCIDEALKNNPAIQAAISTTEIQKSKIGQTKANYFPKVSVNSGYDRLNPIANSGIIDKSRDNYILGSVTLDQLVYDFGKTSIEAKAKEALYDSSRADLQGVINNIKLQVKTSYYYLLYTLHQKEVMSDTVKQFDQHLVQAKAFYQVGTKPKIDVTIAEVNLNDAKLNLIKADNEVEVAIARLNNSMGIPDKSNYKLTDKLKFPLYEMTFDNLREIAYKTRPDLEAARLKTDSYNRYVKLAEKSVFPKIQASTGYGVGGSSFVDDNSFAMGINLDLPVFNGYLVKKQIAEARAVFDTHLSTAQKLQQDAYLDVKQAYLSYSETSKRVPAAKLSLKQAKENYDLSSGRYKVGLGDPIELKDAEIMQMNAKLNYYKALYDYNIAISTIEKAIGVDLTPKAILNEEI